MDYFILNWTTSIRNISTESNDLACEEDANLEHKLLLGFAFVLLLFLGYVVLALLVYAFKYKEKLFYSRGKTF